MKRVELFAERIGRAILSEHSVLARFVQSGNVWSAIENCLNRHRL